MSLLSPVQELVGVRSELCRQAWRRNTRAWLEMARALKLSSFPVQPRLRASIDNTTTNTCRNLPGPCHSDLPDWLTTSSAMPRIISRTPRWLSRPAPGHTLFAKDGRRNSIEGPQRTIAHRGTEIFVAVGNELRWADLVLLKEQGEGRVEEEAPEFKVRWMPWRPGGSPLSLICEGTYTRRLC